MSSTYVPGPSPAAFQANASFNGNNAGNANVPACVTMDAESGYAWNIGAIVFSYEDTPTGGSLQVLEAEDADWGNATVKWGPIPITAGGPGPITFNPALQFGSGNDVRVELANAGVAGYLAVSGWKGRP